MSIPPPPPPFGSNPPHDAGSTPPQYGQPAPPPGYPQPGYPPGPQPSYAPGPLPPGYQAYQQGYGGAPNFAGFGSRLGAFIIDSLISAVFAVPAIIAILAGPKEIELCEIDDQTRLCEVPTGTGWAIFAALLTVGVIAYLIIYCRMVGKGQSWGMKAVGNKVVGANDGQPIGTGRAVGRYFGRILSQIPCYLGFFWMLWDQRKQTWHDKMVSSIVVKS